MSDPVERLVRQAKWQKSLRDLSWPEKVRMAEKAREDLERLRRAAVKRTLRPGL